MVVIEPPLQGLSQGTWAHQLKKVTVIIIEVTSLPLSQLNRPYQSKEAGSVWRQRLGEKR